MSVFKRPGSETYSYDFQYRGHRFSGSTECTNKRDAERFEVAEKARAKAAEADPGKNLPFGVALSLYWNEVGQFHVNSSNTERDLAWLQKHVGPMTLMSDISDATVARLVARRRGETVRNSEELVSAATVNRTVCEPLNAIHRRAAKTWKAKVQEIDWPKHFLRESEERVREATVAEETKLVDAMREDYVPALQFAIMTGCRRAEIVGLQWTSVDLINREFRVTGKGDRSRTIPMTKAVFNLLWAMKNDHPTAVFTYVAKKTRDGRERGKRYPITIEGFKTAWRRGPRDGAVEDFRFHDTRHTAATRLVRTTGNLRLAQRLLGHKDITTTTRYAHVTHADLRAGLEATEAAKNPTKVPRKTRVFKTKV